MLSEDLPLVDTEFLPLGSLTPAEAAAEVEQVIAVVNQCQSHFAALGVCPRDIESLAQRAGFAPAQYASRSKKKPRRSPFQ